MSDWTKTTTEIYGVLDNGDVVMRLPCGDPLGFSRDWVNEAAEADGVLVLTCPHHPDQQTYLEARRISVGLAERDL